MYQARGRECELSVNFTKARPRYCFTIKKHRKTIKKQGFNGFLKSVYKRVKNYLFIQF